MKCALDGSTAALKCYFNILLLMRKHQQPVIINLFYPEKQNAQIAADHWQQTVAVFSRSKNLLHGLEIHTKVRNLPPNVSFWELL